MNQELKPQMNEQLPFIEANGPLLPIHYYQRFGKRVYAAQYLPRGVELPGLGDWELTDAVVASADIAASGQWLRQPTYGDIVFVKASELADYPTIDEDYERATLLILNKIFSQSDRHRPALMYGYGTVPSAPSRYIVMEHIPSNFISLSKMVDAQGHLSVPVALDILIALTEVLIKIHTSHVAHCDLNPSHVYYNDVDKSLRVIDWNNSAPINYMAEPEDGFMFDFAAFAEDDRNEATKILYFLLTGTKLLYGWEEKFHEIYHGDMKAELYELLTEQIRLEVPEDEIPVTSTYKMMSRLHYLRELCK